MAKVHDDTPGSSCRTTTCGPTQDDWIRYKDVIIKLYKRRPLEEVRNEMEVHYKFFASKRMYDQRFKQWKVSKNVKRPEKERLAREIVEAGGNTTSLDITSAKLAKIMRYIQSQTRQSEACNMSRLSSRSTQRTSPSPTAPDRGHKAEILNRLVERKPPTIRVTFLPSSTSEEESDAESSPQSTVCSWTSSELALSTPNSGYSPRAVSVSLSPILSTQTWSFNTKLRTDEFVMMSVDQYFNKRLSELPRNVKPEQVVALGSTSISKQFWSNVENGIYFWKIADTFPDKHKRAYTAFNEACQTVPDAVRSEPFDFLRKILLALSPSNTQIYPDIRHFLLRVIATWASPVLGANHPITRICEALQHDGDDQYLSCTALQRMHAIAADRLGTSHAVSYKLMDSLITLARRSGELQTAKSLADDTFQLAASDHGPDAAVTRNAASELGHVLTKLGEHERALELRMGIVADQASEPVVFRKDGITVHTMEDIAEYYANRGEVDEAICWLRRAEKMAMSIWGNDIATVHISDKLDELLGMMEQQHVVADHENEVVIVLN